MKESQKNDDVQVRWTTFNGTRIGAYFVLPRLEVQDVRLAPGDELMLSYEGELHAKWHKKGVVLKVPDSIINLCRYFRRNRD